MIREYSTQNLQKSRNNKKKIIIKNENDNDTK